MIAFTLTIPEPKIRKKQAPRTKVFKNKKAYDRKNNDRWSDRNSMLD